MNKSYVNNRFSVSCEKIDDKNGASYIFGLPKTDAKDMAIQFFKLAYRKLEKIKFFAGKNTIVAEFVHKDQWQLIVDSHIIPLTNTTVEVIMSFLLDATDEYMNYDHIDLELWADNIMFDICFIIK